VFPYPFATVLNGPAACREADVLVAGKSMDGVGRFLVRGVAWELRAAVKEVEAYLRSNNLPQYSSG
jgi:hypothetical protein